MLKYGRKPVAEPPYRYVGDKHNQRYGLVLAESESQGMLAAVKSAKKVYEFKGQAIIKDELVEAVEGLRTAVMEAYPGYMDLPEWEASLLMLEEKVELEMLETEDF